MSVVLTNAEYKAACAYAGDWLASERPELIPAGRPTGGAVGIYLISTPCPQSSRPRVVYVGRANRVDTGGDIADRIAAHLRGPNAPLVTWVSVIPLLEETPATDIARIEGDIARYFGVPRLCRAVPSKGPAEVQPVDRAAVA